MAGNIKLDLKQFKHVSSDKSSTTLQHKDGHQLVLAHKALSPESQAQLGALSKLSKSSETPDQTNQRRDQMAEGGDVKKPEQKIDYKQVRDEKRKINVAEASKPPVKKFADGGDIGGVQDIIPPQDPAAPARDTEIQDLYNKIQGDGMTGSPSADQFNPGRAPFVFGKDGKAPETFSPSAWDRAESEVGENRQDAARSMQKSAVQTQADNEVRARAGLPPLPLPGGITAQDVMATKAKAGAQAATEDAVKADLQARSAEQMAAQQQRAPSNDPMGGGSHDPEGMLAGGYNRQMHGIAQQAEAQGALGQAQANVLNQQVQAQQQAQQSFQGQYKELEKERQAHMSDIRNGYIDPEQYWTGTKDAQGNQVGGHSKIASAIGMILGGFNPSGKPNAAIEFLQHNMDMNLKAQEANLGAKQNLLSANLRQFGNLKDATEMTRIMQNDTVAHQLQAAAATAQTPMAKAAALQAAGQLQMQTAPLFQQFAMRRAMMNLTNNGGSPQAVEHMLGYMRMVNPEQAKEMESRYVPGVGLASTPVPQDVRSQMVSKQQFGAAVNDLRDWSMKHSGAVDPRIVAEGRTKAANVQNLYRQGINGGVFKQGEQSFINGIIDSDPAKFFNNVRVLPKLNEAARENSASLNILKQGYGLPVQVEAQQPQIKTFNGVQYMRGPDGKAIPVPQHKAK